MLNIIYSSLLVYLFYTLIFNSMYVAWKIILAVSLQDCSGFRGDFQFFVSKWEKSGAIFKGTSRNIHLTLQNIDRIFLPIFRQK